MTFDIITPYMTTSFKGTLEEAKLFVEKGLHLASSKRGYRTAWDDREGRSTCRVFNTKGKVYTAVTIRPTEAR